MNTTATETATDVEKSDAKRLREDLDQLRHDVRRLSENMGATTSHRVRSNTAAARAGLDEARHRTAAMGRAAGGEIKARPLTVAAVASAVGLLALAVYMQR